MLWFVISNLDIYRSVDCIDQETRRQQHLRDTKTHDKVAITEKTKNKHEMDTDRQTDRQRERESRMIIISP